MKNHEHPEFQLFHDMQNLFAEQPDFENLGKTLRRTQDIINENAVSVMQHAQLYVIIRRWGDLYPETRATLRRLLRAALDSLDDEDNNKGAGCGLS